MKKRCTNSKCRKIFSYSKVGTGFILAVCPYCGKSYNRISENLSKRCIIDDQNYSFSLMWIHPDMYEFYNSKFSDGKLNAIKHIRFTTSLKLRESKEIVDYITSEKKIPIQMQFQDRKLIVLESIPYWKLEQYVQRQRQVWEKKNGMVKLKNPQNDSIDEWDMSVRAYNCLKRAGYSTLADFITITAEDLMKVRNMGRKSLDEVTKILNEKGVLL